MIKKYYLKDLDVSQLPLPVREQLEKGCLGTPYKMIGYLLNSIEPKLCEKTGEYHTYWILFTTEIQQELKQFLSNSKNNFSSCDDGIGSFTIMISPWVSPRIDKYLENILITKEGDL